MSKQFSLVLSLAAAAGIAGCANTSGSTSSSCSALTASHTKPTADWQGSVFTIVMENRSYGDIIGNGDAPFINALAKQNAIAQGYHDSFVHPSEPNYLWMVAGENFGVLDDNDPSSHPIASTSHIADQLELAGLTWKSYQESMTMPCQIASQYPYAAKHDPFVFFEDLNGWDGARFNPTQRCNDHVVAYSQLAADLASGNVPRYVFITPNMLHDMHDGTVADGDKWLAQELPAILSSPAFNNGGVIFLMWDEGGGYPQSDNPPMIVISPHAKPGYVSTASYDTSSYLKTVQTILGLQPLPCVANATGVQPMADLFTVPLTATDAGTTPATGTATPAPATTTPATGAATPAPATTAPATAGGAATGS
jgi:phospholipase C